MINNSILGPSTTVLGILGIILIIVNVAAPTAMVYFEYKQYKRKGQEKKKKKLEKDLEEYIIDRRNSQKSVLSDDNDDDYMSTSFKIDSAVYDGEFNSFSNGDDNDDNSNNNKPKLSGYEAVKLDLANLQKTRKVVINEKIPLIS